MNNNIMHTYFSFSALFFLIILCFNGCLTTSARFTGGGFATGVIDLGGLLIRQVSSFENIWAASDGGPDNLGATFYEPVSVPEGFYVLGSYVKPNNIQQSDYVVVAKDVINDPLKPILKPPIDYTLVWRSSNYNASKETGIGHIWLPVPPNGYKAVGYVVTNTSEKPLLEKIRCVRSDYVNMADIDKAIPTGLFVAQNGGLTSTTILGGLKNLNGENSSMPNLDQIKSLFETYSPVIYFHAKEEFLPASVGWFLENGAVLYHKGEESNPIPIDATGENLPQGGLNDGTYWIDLPIDGNARDKVIRGDLNSSEVYLHVKSVNEGTMTDISIWIYYTFQGGAKAKLKFINIGLGKIGEHVSDWEHITLRINNFDGELTKVFFSQHKGGKWVDASQLEYYKEKKPIVYASLHGHVPYPHAGLFFSIGGKGFGIREDTAKSNLMLDTGVHYSIVAAEYLGSDEIVEPPWLNYYRAWGPKIEYDLEKEFEEIKEFVPGIFRKFLKLLEKIVRALPPDVLVEDGPVGPKVKESWNREEKLGLGWP